MTFISFDLETTGFIAGVDRIVEIGAVKFVDGVVDSVYSTLVDPEMEIPEAASRVNGISNEMVRGKPKIDRLLESFASFCGDDVLVAHNAGFDFQFLVSDIVKFESPAPRGTVLDSCNIARKVIPGLPNYKLGTLVQHMKIESDEFHRAEADANYCGQVFLKLIEKMSGGLQMPPIQNLITLSGKVELKFPQITPSPKQLGLF